MGGDKIVLLDGAGANGGGAAANGLLSMIPGMFANLIGGNKMDPNLVAALMNGRNNQDGFGGANGWWLWIIVLFWLWGGRGFGNGFGNGGDCCANGLPAQLNNDYGRELLMQAIQGNRSAIDQIASALNCSTTQLQNAICNVQGAIDKVAGQVGMTSHYLDIHKEDSQTGKRYRVIVYDPLRKPNCPTVNIVCDYDISSDTFQSIHFESHNFSSKTINIDVDSYSLHFDDLFDFNHLTMQQGSEISIDSESIVNERKSVIVELSNQSDQDMTLKFNNIPIKISSQEGERDIFFRILNIPGTSTLFIERIYTTQLSVDKN